MKLDLKQPPRTYLCGADQKIEIKDCGTVQLEENEQVTFVTPSGGEYDVARKSWGFYATPSINSRLLSFKIRTALTRNTKGQFYIMLVEEGHETDFLNYIQMEKNDLVAWLDDTTLPLMAAAV